MQFLNYGNLIMVCNPKFIKIVNYMTRNNLKYYKLELSTLFKNNCIISKSSRYITSCSYKGSRYELNIKVI